MGYEPLDVQDIYRQNSGVLRDYARPTYKEMYPISDIAHQFVGSGGLTGMLLQKALGDGVVHLLVVLHKIIIKQDKIVQDHNKIKKVVMKELLID
jgi:hypothetical protein